VGRIKLFHYLLLCSILIHNFNGGYESLAMSNPDEHSKFYFQWHITDRCNLRCSHCYQENYSDATELSLDQLKKIADGIFVTLSKWNKKGDISITGGEPFFREDTMEFAEYLNDSPDVSNIDFLTNGTLIDKTFISAIKRLQKIKYVQISLDGATPSVHDRIRGKGNFEKALKAIRNLINNDIEVRVMYTLQRVNVSEVPAMFDMALRENISGLTFERMIPIDKSKNSDDVVLSTDAIKEIYQYISQRTDAEYDRGNRVRVLKYRPLWVLIDPCRINDNTNPQKELGSLCSIGLDGICILPNADVLACRRLPIPIGNLSVNKLEDIWSTSALLWEVADKSNLKGKCKNCEYIPKCSGCRAMAYAVTGDYLSEDPNCWKSMHQTL
jgi:radical SAM protein with 4Fe4S-binding SPASM domain